MLASKLAATAPKPAAGVASDAAPRGGHVVELDGIRALAIWLVLATHLPFTQPATPAGSAFIPRPVAAILAHGWLGVDLFVLSGFLITGVLLRTKAIGRRRCFGRFYLQRVPRIVPLYFVVLVILFATFRGSYAAYSPSVHYYRPISPRSRAYRCPTPPAPFGPLRSKIVLSFGLGWRTRVAVTTAAAQLGALPRAPAARRMR